ncbi:MAG TPA: hypothetical protein VGQ22_11125 [Steroidobacteraceae bacterium]|nr:hypothetical protein [Steroidobacteraceae bacterium]
MFPPGLPGLALILLRSSVTLGLLLADLDGWARVGGILISVALFVGYLTPLAAAAALALHGIAWISAGVDSTAVAVVFALDAIALALLGPGAYSIDSHRFGRRLVVLPPK